MAMGLKTWSQDLVLCSHGTRIPPALRGRLARNGIEVRTDRIARLDHRGGRLTAVRFEQGGVLPRAALFFASSQHHQSNLAKSLGCLMNRRGTVKTGTLSETNVPGVFVAGDASRDAQFVVVAAGEGVKAAMAINRALQRREQLA
jgi:thioredoxin reductase